MSSLEIFFWFATLWVAIIAGTIYLIRRLTAPARQRGTCCLEVPCSAKCAREHQAARDRLTIAYDKVARELGAIVTAGQETDGHPGAAAAPEDWATAN